MKPHITQDELNDVLIRCKYVAVREGFNVDGLEKHSDGTVTPDEDICFRRWKGRTVTEFWLPGFYTKSVNFKSIKLLITIATAGREGESTLVDLKVPMEKIPDVLLNVLPHL